MMLMDGAVHPSIVRAGLRVLLAVEINLKCCFLAKFRQWDRAMKVHTQQVCPSHLLKKVCAVSMKGNPDKPQSKGLICSSVSY